MSEFRPFRMILIRILFASELFEWFWCEFLSIQSFLNDFSTNSSWFSTFWMILVPISLLSELLEWFLFKFATDEGFLNEFQKKTSQMHRIGRWKIVGGLILLDWLPLQQFLICPESAEPSLHRSVWLWQRHCLLLAWQNYNKSVQQRMNHLQPMLMCHQS